MKFRPCGPYATLLTKSSTYPVCRTADVFRRTSFRCRNIHGERQQIAALFPLTKGKNTMMKTLIVAGATLAFVTVAGAADLPHPQPVYKAEPAPVVGKMPIGKAPIGKGPIGKEPVVTRAY